MVAHTCNPSTQKDEVVKQNKTKRINIQIQREEKLFGGLSAYRQHIHRFMNLNKQVLEVGCLKPAVLPAQVAEVRDH